MYLASHLNTAPAIATPPLPPSIGSHNLAPEEPLNFQYSTSIVLIVIGLLAGIVSVIFTAFANDYYNENWESDAIIAQATGGLATILFIVAVPLFSCAAGGYKTKRQFKGILGCFIASWVVYGFAMLNDIALVGVSVAGGYVAAGWVVAAVIVSVLSWVLMFIHTEATRKQLFVLKQLLIFIYDSSYFVFTASSKIF